MVSDFLRGLCTALTLWPSLAFAQATGSYTASYPSDVRPGAGVKVEKNGLSLKLSLDYSNVQSLSAAPSAGWVLVQDPISKAFQRLDFQNLPLTTPSNGSVTNAKFAAAPALTVKGNATGAPAQPQDIPLSSLGFAARGVNTDITSIAPNVLTLPPGSNASSGNISGMSVTGDPTKPAGTLANILAPYIPVGGTYYLPTFQTGSTVLQAIGTATGNLTLSTGAAVNSAGQPFGGVVQFQWQWGTGKPLALGAFDATGFRGFPLFVSQVGQDLFGTVYPGQTWGQLGGDYPLNFLATVTPTASNLGGNVFTVNNESQQNMTGHFFKYYSKGQYYGGFDVGFGEEVQFDPSGSATGTTGGGGIGAAAAVAMYGKAGITRCPTRAQVDALTLKYGCAYAEINVVNADRDYGFISDPFTVTSPLTGMFVLVPEAFRGTQANKTAFDTTYGILFGRSGGKSDPVTAAGDHIRTHAALLGAPDSISIGDGRFIYATGATQHDGGPVPTFTTSPYAFAQAAGYWNHGIDTTLATFFGGDALHLKTGHAIAFDTAGNAKLFADASGAIASTAGRDDLVFTPTAAAAAAGIELTGAMHHLSIDASSGNAVLNLPACTAATKGRHYAAKKIDSSGNWVSFSRAGSDLIDGQVNSGLNSTQYAVQNVRCSDTAGRWDKW